MSIFGHAAAAAVLVRLRCPRCGEVQARARVPDPRKYACRKCHREFTNAEGGATGRAHGR